MSHRHHGLGPLLIVAAIAYAFGNRAARGAVGTALIVCVLLFCWIMFLVIDGRI